MKLSPFIGACVALVVAGCTGGDPLTKAAKGDSYTATVHQADAARLAGDLDSAIPLYGRALQANPQGAEAKMGLGQAYLSMGAGDEAAAQFRDVLARHDDNAARRGLAAALIAQGQPALAEKQAALALQIDGHDYRALNVIGVSLDMQGRNAEAQARYREGISLGPDYLPLRSNLALSLAISGQPQEAIALLAPLVAQKASDVRMRQNLAFAYAMAGDMENALQLCRRDLAEPSAQRQLAYFLQLRSLPPEVRNAEMRRNPSFFPQSKNNI